MEEVRPWDDTDDVAEGVWDGVAVGSSRGGQCQDGAHVGFGLGSAASSALKSGPVLVLGLSGLGPWTGLVLIFPNMEGLQTGLHKTGFTRSWAVLGPVLVKTDS